MSAPDVAGKPNPRGWRRKWRRVPIERRRAAGETLGDLFAPPERAGKLLIGVLLLSLIAHAGLLPMLAVGRQTALDDLAVREDSYLQKVMQKQRARKISRDVKGRLTMPPPPPDPEAVISGTLSEALTTDIGKVVGNVADVKLTSRLADRVRSSLADELKAAARNIAQGEYSEEEIRKLHDQFRKKAHQVAVDELKTHRIETQVERASMSTKQWYEKDVSRVLMPNMHLVLFRTPHYQVWYSEFGRRNPTMHWGRWGFLGLGGYDRKLRQLDQLVSAPGAPGAEDAARLSGQLKAIRGRQIFDGRFAQWYSWQTALGHYIEDYHCHQADAVRAKHVGRLDGLWTAALAGAKAYKDQADAGAAPGELKAARAKAIAAAKQLAAAAGEVLVRDGRPYRDINQAVRSRVLRGPAREKMYTYLMDEWVAGLAPMIRDFARSQFKKGILVHKAGVDQAMKEFPKTIVPLLRRDLEAMFPKKEFDVRVFGMPYSNPYRSRVTGDSSPPSAADVRRDEAALAAALKRRPDLAAYADKRSEIIVRQLGEGIERVKETLLLRVLTGNLILRDMSTFAEGVDYADRVKERLDAREMAMAGRGQDLARLTPEGLPDTSGLLVALVFGASKGHGASLQPVNTVMQPRYVTPASVPERILRRMPPAYPKPPAKWGFETQAQTRPTFRTPRFEAIPFLAQFPQLDGNLTDWGKIRPLVLRLQRGEDRPMIVYAAWNYQGFFFGYEVTQPEEMFYWPSQWRAGGAHDYFAIVARKVGGYAWAFAGDHLHLLFDTLDARRPNRGEPHTQEFVVFPRGTDSNPAAPGIERVIASQRDAKAKQWRQIKASAKVFPFQPPRAHGPDGRGPYRVTRVIDSGPRAGQGYSVEVFIPRSLFNVPVFCPGWHVGFDCAIATGVQGRNRFKGQRWAGDVDTADTPDRWGDLLLLGTDPRIIIQEANASGRLTRHIVPGQSYLLTVIDPDRNISLSAKDTVLVSAEADGGRNDVEVFCLEETEPNSSVFRGFIDTQPGLGREIQGVLEVMPCQQVRFGYVDISDAKGRRNVVFEIKMPVAAPVLAGANGAGSARGG